MNTLVIDCEVSINYFLVAAYDGSETVYFEKYNDSEFDHNAVSTLMANNKTVGFNSINYDLLMIVAALKGFSNIQLYKLSNRIINSNSPAYVIAKDYNLIIPAWNHTDIINIAPGIASLKIYGCRMHSRIVRDLPFVPDKITTQEDLPIIREYCHNDLLTTFELYQIVLPQIDLRIEISKLYQKDLRSKSDAQIAEIVLLILLQRDKLKPYQRKIYAQNSTFHFEKPDFIKFKTDLLKSVLDKILTLRFELSPNGALKLPKELGAITIGNSTYAMGMGGLHSSEKNQLIYSKEGYVLKDFDVTSYYPSIILNQKLFPQSAGSAFTKIYQSLVLGRLEAKKSGDVTRSETFKIVLNSSFGKLGNKWSFLYAPGLFLQVVLTGQLSLLMLIEMLELNNIQVVSANTDGIVVFTQHTKLLEKITTQWQQHTGFALEETDYKTLVSRDVNNYFAVKADDTVKVKGIFAYGGLSKNPDCDIVQDAIINSISEKQTIEQTVTDCQDIRKFLMTRKVTGGASFQGVYLGRAVRYYHSTEIPQSVYITYDKNSNKVPKSAGCRPLMELPDTFPGDVDKAVYIDLANKFLTTLKRERTK